MDKSKFFIAIGPPKTGTTWLYFNLIKHPEVFLPRVKEIRYFWANEAFSKNNLYRSLFDKHWYFEGKRGHLRRSLRGYFYGFIRKRQLNFRNLKWDLYYFFGKNNDKWYQNLFPNDCLSGDISPHYSRLSEDSILKIRKLIPSCKIIISLRDPIERDWSRVKMVLLKQQGCKSIEDVPSNKVKYQLELKEENIVNDYSTLVQSWLKYFPKEQVFIYHFEELVEKPQDLLDRICGFLDIEQITIPTVNSKINEGSTEDIPDIYLKELIKLNFAYIKNYAADFPNSYSASWLEKYDKISNSINV